MKPVVISFYTAGTPYEVDAAKLAASCIAHGYALDLTPIPAGPSWTAVNRMKPQIIREAARRHYGRPLLFLDADCWFTARVPWLEREHGDLALWKVDPNAMRPGQFLQRHKHQGLRRGSLWAGGRLLFGRGGRLEEILTAWERMFVERSGDWGDQIHLQIACERLGIEAKAMPAHVVDAIAHESGFHRHHLHPARKKRERPERKVLVLGSAPDVPAWWERNRARYVREGFTIAAINNAWRVPALADLDLWLHPLDFAGPEPPPEIPRNSTIGYRALGYDVGQRFDCWVIAPYWLRGEVRLTVTDALTHLLNESIADEVRLTVHVAGCDMVYPRSGPTHFYGTGVPDPLRFPAVQVRAALMRLQAFYRDAGATLYNVGGRSDTRLPFQRLVAA